MKQIDKKPLKRLFVLEKTHLLFERIYTQYEE